MCGGGDVCVCLGGGGMCVSGGGGRRGREEGVVERACIMQVPAVWSFATLTVKSFIVTSLQ